MAVLGIALVGGAGHARGGDKTWTNGDSHDRVDGEYQFWSYLIKSSVPS